MNLILSQAEKDSLGISHDQEIFIVTAESLDFCGISYSYAVVLPADSTEDAVVDFVQVNYETDIHEDIEQHYDEEDMEELEGEVSIAVKVEDASEWKASWLDNSCTKMNF